MIKKRLLTVLLVLMGLSAIKAQVKPHHKYALTPPMGWNSWNCFKRFINERQIKEVADAMEAKGFVNAGYQYLVIDDGWALSRDKDGNIQADPAKFPGGIKALADYIHSKGLKFGIYTGPGKTTCAGYTGSYGFEQKDVDTYAGWGVDFIKLDWCSGCDEKPQEVAARWRKVLDKANRPMVLSINFGQEAYSYASEYANMWRTTTDIVEAWDEPITETNFLPCSVTRIADQQPGLEKYQFPGAWNDPDMLQVGNGLLTLSENRSHFSLWAILGAPLMMGNDLRTISPELNELLINREVIAVNQDSLGFQGRRIFDSGKDISRIKKNYGIEVWAKKLQPEGEFAVLLLNRSSFDTFIKVKWSELGLKDQITSVRDLWQHKDLGAFNKYFGCTVAPHDVALIRVKGKEIDYPKLNTPEWKDSLVVEAEKGLLARAVRGSFYGGKYSGTGYVEFLTMKSKERYIRLVVNVPDDGTYKVGIRYANGDEKKIKMILNHAGNDTEIECPPTKSFKDWSAVTTPMKLTRGLNVIKILSDEYRCPLIDYLIVRK